MSEVTMAKGNFNVVARTVSKYASVCLGVVLLNGCAKDNALLQSPVANTVETIEQITLDLDATLRPEPEVVEVPDDVLAALTPDFNVTGQAKAQNRFDISVDNLAANIFFSGLVEGTPYNMVVHPEVSGSISLNLKDVTIEEILEISQDIYGYEYEQKGNLIKIFPAGLHTRIFAIDYLDISRKGGSETRVSSGQITQNTSASSSEAVASGSSSSGTGTLINTYSESTFWQNLDETLKTIVGSGEGRSVVITPSAGVVVVKAHSDELAAVKQYLESAELIMQRQVILEAKILEVELSKEYQQGIDWSLARGWRYDGDTPLRTLDLGQTAQSVIGEGLFSTALRIDNFNTTIDLLGSQGNVQVLSSPRISTVNNQKAVIKVGSDEYFVTDIDFESDNDADSSSTDISLTPFFSGIALDVTPQISEEGKIVLHVHPTISEVEDQNKLITIGDQTIDLPLALSSIRESDTVITAENGQIVVIGGLIQSRNKDRNSSVPFFGDLPLIGELFKQKNQAKTKTELVILLRPIVADAQTYLDDIRASRSRFGEFQKFLAKPPETDFYE